MFLKPSFFFSCEYYFSRTEEKAFAYATGQFDPPLPAPPPTHTLKKKKKKKREIKKDGGGGGGVEGGGGGGGGRGGGGAGGGAGGGRGGGREEFHYIFSPLSEHRSKYDEGSHNNIHVTQTPTLRPLIFFSLSLCTPPPPPPRDH